MYSRIAGTGASSAPSGSQSRAARRVPSASGIHASCSRTPSVAGWARSVPVVITFERDAGGYAAWISCQILLLSSVASAPTKSLQWIAFSAASS